MDLVQKSIKRKSKAKSIIRRRMLYSAGLGLIPIPIVDTAGILGIQVLMIKDIAKIYRVPFKKQIVKSFIGSLVGSLGTTSVIKAIPGLGTITGGIAVSLAGVAATYAVGKVFTLHFEQGGTLLDFDPVKSRNAFEKAFKEGELKAAAIKEANKGKIGSLFKAKKSNQPVVSNINGQTKAPINGKEQTAEMLKAQAKYDAIVKAVKRRKAVKAKVKRKTAFSKYLKRLIIFTILFGIATLFYRKYIRFRFNYSKDTTQSNEIELFLQENEAKQYQLDANPKLDSLSLAIINSFSPVSTEGVISRYLQNPNSTYPKRYSLNAVRFSGTSEKISSGAENQLEHIALLMKKYPNLLVNLYGHTGSKGPVFNRQRIGRDRARVLTEVFTNFGISSYRITGNYIEKQEDLNDGYWGAEIVLYVATIENVVEVAPRQEKKILSPITEVIKKVREEEIPEEEEETATNNTAQEKEDVKSNKRNRGETQKETIEEVANSPILPESKIDTQQNLEIADTNNQLIDKKVEETRPIPKPEPPKKDSAKKVTPPQKSTEIPKPAPKKVTLEGVMQTYIESPNPKYPKAFPLNTVSFNGEDTNVNPGGKALLEKIAALMQKYPKMQVKVSGHGAGTATVDTQEEKNQFLLKWQGIGLRRANAIKKILHGYGIPNKRIKTGHRLQNQGADTPSWGADMVIERN